jgi:hypothetical protein
VSVRTPARSRLIARTCACNVRHRIHPGGPSHSTKSSPLEHVSCGMRGSWRAVQVQLMSHRCLLCPCIEAISCTHEIVATCSVLNVHNHACSLRVVGESTGNHSHTVHSACLARLNLCARSSVAACALHYMQTDGAKGIKVRRARDPPIPLRGHLKRECMH